MKSLSLNNPHAIIMVGIPGSGKTFFAKKFSQTFHIPYLDIAELKQLAKDDAAADELLIKQSEELIKTKASLIVDAEASTRQRRTELARFFREAGYIPMFIWVQTDPEAAKQRVQKAKMYSADEFASAMKRFSAPHESERPLVLSGKHTYASQAKVVLLKLSRPRAAISTHDTAPVRSGQITVR